MDNYGSGVSRVLNPDAWALLQVIWQAGKPPCDAELNLSQQLGDEWDRIITLREMPSGWLSNETNPGEDFVTNATWSNWFRYGRQSNSETQSITWAVVNGWLIPVTATLTGLPPGAADNTSTWNKITLDPPPSSSGDFRVDYVFLEVWKAAVAPNPSTVNKPSNSGIYFHGNVESGHDAIADDIQDPALGIETTRRVQLQYRVRVVTGLVGLSSYPDGFDPTVVKAQGAATAPTSWTFTNMRKELGDAGLWRAGDGTTNTLGTVDGYVYAIPMCVVFRRNSQPWNGEPSPNLNGGLNRNPTATNRTGVKTFSTVPTIATAALTATAMTLTLSSATNIALPATPASPVLIRIGDELLEYTLITGTTMTLATRGARGTRAEVHPVGTQVLAVSERPDKLFSDQVATTDILDLRHLVNPNGFDYESLLKTNLDKLMRGQLRSTWKYTSAGVQGTFVNYQDYVGASPPPAAGADKIDSPDNIRQIFSDAACVQRCEAIVKANALAVPASVNVAWSLGLTVNQTTRQVVNQFNPPGVIPGGVDVITIPLSSFKLTLPASDQDQVRFIDPGYSNAIEIRVDGIDEPIPASAYTVTPPTPTSSDDLVITLGAGFPTAVTSNVYITFHVVYGAGRGISHRALSLHNISYYNPGTDVMTQQEQQPTNNVPLRTAWAPLWAKYCNTAYRGLIPVTAESYADLGSKTVILTPFRSIAMPNTFTPLDGNGLWGGAALRAGTNGQSAAGWSNTLTDTTVDFTTGVVIQPGDRVVITTGASAGSYAITAVATTQLTLSSRLAPTVGFLSYSIYRGAGLMPIYKRDGVTLKWTTGTDPLEIFSGQSDTVAARKNIYVTVPRHLVPAWGEVRTPIQHNYPDTGTFHEGVNYLVLSKKGSAPPNSEKNYVAYTPGGSPHYAIFTTWNWNLPEASAAYNTKITVSGTSMAGMRKFNDNIDPARPTARGLGRLGLELPPFYGIARLFAVYEAQDYKVRGSAYDANTRDLLTTTGHATNLLRQNMDPSVPVFWIEKDDDGDSTFILNAEAIDITRSPNTITSFTTGEYVIEACVFGFDRDAFDLDQECRIVLTRERLQANNPARSANVGEAVTIDGPTCVIPAPPAATDVLLVNYSRTPYQGDPFGSQTLFVDQGYYPGPLTTINAYNMSTTQLSENSLTRANQKPLEVLASIGFVTTLGTGRMSGSISSDPTSAYCPGGEDLAEYPPATISSARPRVYIGVLTADFTEAVATEYLGCTERLPLGSLFRDKDFRGGKVSGYGDIFTTPMTYTNGTPGVYGTSLQSNKKLECFEAPLDCATPASGQAGEILVAVDGSPNVNQYLAFRTFRGGSVFNASGGHPGGEMSCAIGFLSPPVNYTNVLSGKAMLVRNVPTSQGLSEVSAGDELMMLIVTTATRCVGGGSALARVIIGTNGTGEGVSASDLYRLEGHPLIRNNVGYVVDPTSIVLSRHFGVAL
jgi:hypothetical protein